ncbi:hypothetical protein Btru_045917 [Bulinus truncatus]|nr:hypothetical protein Btru_045917 [Bulinus truncatus]
MNQFVIILRSGNIEFGRGFRKMGGHVISLCFLVIASMALVAAQTTIDRNENCTDNGRVYLHNQIYNHPHNSDCVQFQCINGTKTTIKEGCFFNGACIALEHLIYENCHVKKCLKTRRNGFSVYSLEIIVPGCQDYLGKCHFKNEEYSDQKNGRNYSFCKCHVSGSTSETICS